MWKNTQIIMLFTVLEHIQKTLDKNIFTFFPIWPVAVVVGVVISLECVVNKKNGSKSTENTIFETHLSL